ncbi:hypothetical protein AAFF_G00111290 [Aldrovandia affinis]|uniref:Uncharacterized protein n=1 Tax=Aldrovandia affinis TaxID=143900 RepID=A0AAD7RTW6_9TELE|nr:hypothetical protein AAFF_G00111290 [Aldrovandia affinis]
MHTLTEVGGIAAELALARRRVNQPLRRKVAAWLCDRVVLRSGELVKSQVLPSEITRGAKPRGVDMRADKGMAQQGVDSS